MADVVKDFDLIWLREVERRLTEGMPLDTRELMVVLHDRLPRGFKPADLDPRFFYGVVPSVDGLKAMGDQGKILPDLGKTIAYIREQLVAHPALEKVTAIEVAAALEIAVPRAERILLLMSSIGRFSSSASGSAQGYSWIGIASEDVVAEYLGFESLDDHLASRAQSQAAATLARAESLRREQVPSSAGQPSTLRPLARLFLSHATSDRTLAEYLKAELERGVSGLEVFLTVYPGMIPAGADWLAAIKAELERADGYVVLLTPASVTRPWIWFETGAAWMSKRALATVSAGALDRTTLPMPLASFQVLSLEDPREAASVFTQLGGSLGDPAKFVEEVQRLAIPVGSFGGLGGWTGIEVGTRWFGWDGPTLHALEDRNPTLAPPALDAALRAAGWIPRYGTRAKLMRHLSEGLLQVWETDRAKWRRELLAPGDGDQILLIGKNAA